MEAETTHRALLTGVDIDGFGEIYLDGRCVKVPGAVKGDVVSVEIVHKSAHHATAWGEIVAVHSRGALFETPECPHAWPVNGRCGGCPLMHLKDGFVADLKHRAVVDAMRRVGIDATVRYHTATTTVGYRNRGHFVVARQDGQIVLGAYAPRSHDVITLTGCSVLRAPIAEVSTEVARTLSEMGLPVFPMPDGIRYVTLRASVDKEVLVDVIVTGEAPYLTALGKRLMTLDGVVGVSASANDHGGNVIRTAPSARLEGQYTIIEPVGPLALGLSAAGFSQLNQDVMARMYQRAAGLVEQERPVVWDLYCGVGGLGLTVAHKHDGTTLFGADSVDSAVLLANQNSQDNRVSGRFVTIDLSRTAPRGWPEPDVVLLNPPRRGIDDVIKRRLTEIQPWQLIYMSCNPASFAKDVRFLVDRGYRLDEVHAYDMLPRTAHVEVLAALVREQ